VIELGVALPVTGLEPVAPESLVRIAVAAEEIGYAAIWAGERLMRPLAPVSFYGAPPEPLADIFRTCYEPLELLSHVAALTSRIKLGTSVLNALLQPPVILARRIATLDRLSGGRVIAGLGQGWMREEYEAVGVPFGRIGSGMDEMIGALRACWGPDPVEYSGRFYRIPPSEMHPKPVQQHVPVLLGAVTPAGVERAARIADGLNALLHSEESLLSTATAYRKAVAHTGRDPAGVTVVVRAGVPITAEPIGTDRPFLGGAPEQIADDLARLEGQGIDHVLFANEAFTTADDEVVLLERLWTAAASSRN
jgi:probable F420-dependent oxidoreductase